VIESPTANTRSGTGAGFDTGTASAVPAATPPDEDHGLHEAHPPHAKVNNTKPVEIVHFRECRK
jgi:hypothetical protein